MVFIRHKSGRNFQESENHAADNYAVDHDEAFPACGHVAHGGGCSFSAFVKPAVEPAEEAFLSLVVLDRLKNRGTKCRCQRQGNQDGQAHRSHNRDGELTVNHTGRAAEESHRNEHGRKHHRNTDQSARNLRHGLLGSVMRRKTLLVHHTLDVFHHHNRVVHQQTDRQHHGEHRQHVDGVAHGAQDTEGAQDHHRHGNRRNQRCAEVLQEQIHHEHHQHDSFEQGVDHAFNRNTHERCRVERNHILILLREEMRQLFHFFVD